MMLNVYIKSLAYPIFMCELFKYFEIIRDADLEDDGELLIGPPPPAVVSEAESSNEAERFEEVIAISIFVNRNGLLMSRGSGYVSNVVVEA